MEFILSNRNCEKLEDVRRKFNWQVVSKGDTWYVLDPVVSSVQRNVKYYATDLLYDVARLAPLMLSENPPEDRVVAVFGIRECGVDGIEFVHPRLDAWRYHYKDIFMLREVVGDRGERSFDLFQARGERTEVEEEEF